MAKVFSDFPSPVPGIIPTVRVFTYVGKLADLQSKIASQVEGVVHSIAATSPGSRWLAFDGWLGLYECDTPEALGGVFPPNVALSGAALKQLGDALDAAGLRLDGIRIDNEVYSPNPAFWRVKSGILRAILVYAGLLRLVPMYSYMRFAPPLNLSGLAPWFFDGPPVINDQTFAANAPVPTRFGTYHAQDMCPPIDGRTCCPLFTLAHNDHHQPNPTHYPDNVDWRKADVADCLTDIRLFSQAQYHTIPLISEPVRCAGGGDYLADWRGMIRDAKTLGVTTFWYYNPSLDPAQDHVVSDAVNSPVVQPSLAAGLVQCGNPPILATTTDGLHLAITTDPKCGDCSNCDTAFLLVPCLYPADLHPCPRSQRPYLAACINTQWDGISISGKTVRIDGLCYRVSNGAVHIDPGVATVDRVDAIVPDCNDQSCARPTGYAYGRPCDPAYAGPLMIFCRGALSRCVGYGVSSVPGICFLFDPAAPEVPFDSSAIFVDFTQINTQGLPSTCCECQGGCMRTQPLADLWGRRNPDGTPIIVNAGCCCPEFPDDAIFSQTGEFQTRNLRTSASTTVTWTASGTRLSYTGDKIYTYIDEDGNYSGGTNPYAPPCPLPACAPGCLDQFADAFREPLILGGTLVSLSRTCTRTCTGFAVHADLVVRLIDGSIQTSTYGESVIISGATPDPKCTNGCGSGSMAARFGMVEIGVDKFRAIDPTGAGCAGCGSAASYAPGW